MIIEIAFALLMSGSVEKSKSANSVIAKIDSANVHDGIIDIYVKISNSSKKQIILFPPEYGMYLGILEIELFGFGKSFKPGVMGNVDYDAYPGDTIAINSSRDYLLHYYYRNMYKKNDVGKYASIDSVEYEKILKDTQLLKIYYASHFERISTGYIGGKKITGKNPLFGKYSVLNLVDSIPLIRNRKQE